MITKETPDYVSTTDLEHPVTPDQWDQVVLNDKIATALVRRANHVDLEKIAEKVRR